jgi:hypothetical protein
MTIRSRAGNTNKSEEQQNSKRFSRAQPRPALAVVRSVQTPTLQAPKPNAEAEAPNRKIRFAQTSGWKEIKRKENTFLGASRAGDFAIVSSSHRKYKMSTARWQWRLAQKRAHYELHFLKSLNFSFCPANNHPTVA